MDETVVVNSNGTPEIAPPASELFHQKVELEIDFYNQSLKGKTEITLYPDSTELKVIKLNARQCKLTRLNINGRAPNSKHVDPYQDARLHGQATVHQHHILISKLENATEVPPKEDLILTLPKTFKIEEVNLTGVPTITGGVSLTAGAPSGTDLADVTQTLADTAVARFTPLTITIEYVIDHVRDGLHFVSYDPGNGKYPHAYTTNMVGPGSASCLFPCVDSINARCTWDISIRSPRTIGDALNPSGESVSTKASAEPGEKSATHNKEMVVLCSGEMTDEIMDKTDSRMKTVSFSCSSGLSAQQIGFAVGPFEQVKLSQLRGAQEDEELGQNAVEINGFCLPGRKAELQNTCLPVPRAMDYIVRTFNPCPFRSYNMCFVDDLPADVVVTAGLSICSTRLLYSEDILDPDIEVTRKLAHAIAWQWVGIDIVQASPADAWAIVGISHFMADNFMKELCGNNQHRFRMKAQADQVVKLDRERPPLIDMGAILDLDPAELSFLSLKAPLVLWILDHRIEKVVGLPKMRQIVNKILMRARKGELARGELSTEIFQKTCERFYNAKIDDFVNQWVRGSGCPHFRISQSFNKKKSEINMVIEQIHANRENQEVHAGLEVNSFMRDVREDFHVIYAGAIQPIFTGPMTIRVHEADGTPYEHIVEIKEAVTKLNIHYATKYKRKTRSRQQRLKDAANRAAGEGDGDEEPLLYCLGDVLQAPEEYDQWRLTQPTAEEEQKMNEESYEWIKVDADFEWIAQTDVRMNWYMWLSQLQQDRDVVAQYEAVFKFQQQSSIDPQGLWSTFMVRTLTDRRYFHGIRSVAARALAFCADDKTDMVGWFHLKKAYELLCGQGDTSSVARPNDFSIRPSYIVQCAMLKAMARIRDSEGTTPAEVKEYLLDKLRFNDNSANPFSDCFYISTLMDALSDALSGRFQQTSDIDEMTVQEAQALSRHRRLENDCLAEIDHYRRMDEWTSSYQNTYATSALRCQLKLHQAGLLDLHPSQLLQYTRPGSYEQLRVIAFGGLLDLEGFDNSVMLKYVLFCMGEDPSRYVRINLQDLLGKAFAREAIGIPFRQSKQARGEIVMEDAPSEEAAKLEKDRKVTIDGALRALKAGLEHHEVLKKALWSAIESPYIGIRELSSLLQFCQMIYEPVDEVKVALKYPRYWKVEHEGKGILRFSRTNRIRLRKVETWQPKVQNTVDAATTIANRNASAATVPKLIFKTKPPPRPSPNSKLPTEAAPVPMPTPKPSFKLKLNLKPPPRT